MKLNIFICKTTHITFRKKMKHNKICMYGNKQFWCPNHDITAFENSLLSKILEVQLLRHVTKSTWSTPSNHPPTPAMLQRAEWNSPGGGLSRDYIFNFEILPKIQFTTFLRLYFCTHLWWSHLKFQTNRWMIPWKMYFWQNFEVKKLKHDCTNIRKTEEA